MARLTVDLGDRSYPIHIGSGALASTGRTIARLTGARKVAVITNKKIWGHYGTKCRASLRKAGLQACLIIIPDGERYKNLSTISRIYDDLVKNGLDRSDAILALGGGVAGDMAGFAAATYMRGIDYIQAPTTLLSQVDSSVGGKTGVDHAGGKNLIGAFYQPRAVIADLDVFKTLPPREFRCGLAEVVKYGVIKSETFFRYLEKNSQRIIEGDPACLARIVKESCRIKAEVVAEDEREGGVRAILNYGHTFAHGIETALDYKKVKHGEAVAIGMVMAARLSRLKGLCGPEPEARLISLLKSFGLPVRMPSSLTPEQAIKGMAHDKKITAGKKRFIVIDRIGACKISSDINNRKVREAIALQEE